MKEQVQVQITGIHARPGQRTEKVVTTSAGTYKLTDKGHEITFREKPDGGEETTSILTVSGHRMELRRQGGYETLMQFEKGREHTSSYRTPYGEMEMTIETTELSFLREETRMVASIDYVLSMQGQELSQTLLQIEVREA